MAGSLLNPGCPGDTSTASSLAYQDPTVSVAGVNGFAVIALGSSVIRRWSLWSFLSPGPGSPASHTSRDDPVLNAGLAHGGRPYPDSAGPRQHIRRLSVGLACGPIPPDHTHAPTGCSVVERACRLPRSRKQFDATEGQHCLPGCLCSESWPITNVQAPQPCPFGASS